MLINLSAWLQPTHTFHLPRKEKSLPFSSTHLGLASFSLWRQEVFTFRRAFLITLVSLSHFMEEKTEAGSRGRDSSGLSPLILLVRVNHSLIWGSHRAPNRQEIHLHWLCSWSRADVRWCAEMMWLSRTHPVLLHPTGTLVSPLISFISYAWWSSCLSPQILSLYHLLCAQEPPSLISINLTLRITLWTEQHYYFLPVFILFYNSFFIDV